MSSPENPNFTTAPSGLGRYFLAFQSPGFRLLWGNSFLTWLAFTLEMLGQGWLVLQLTDSPFWVGATAGIKGVSQVVFSVAAGALVDRMDRRKLLLTVQAIGAIATAALAALVLTDAVHLWHVLLIVTLGGTAAAMNFPANAALTYDVVGPARILNASAFRFMGGSAVRILGALAGGYIIDRLGVGANYTAACGAYLAGGVSLLFLKSPPAASRRDEPFLRAVQAGLTYSLHEPRVRRLLFLSLVTEFFGFSYIQMMPVMARDVLKVGATGLGYLTAMGGVGSLVAMLGLASLGDFKQKGWLLVGTVTGFGAAILLFSLSPWYSLSLALAAVIAAFSSTYDSTISTVIQMTVASEMRGRVLGLYVSTFGTNQIGAFLAGGLATLVSAPFALAIGGIVVTANGLRLLRRARNMTPPTTGASSS
ncbi:MAG: MFS transporter [Dehalococcoidia bacterium]|nr:MFS transporter [Dehalococcoidia bacterium]